MHASIEQLLRLRDSGCAAADVDAHLRSCTMCRAEFERLRSLTFALRSLPQSWPPPDRWSAIRSALLPAKPVFGRAARRPGWLLPSASAAAVVIAVLLTWNSPEDSSGAAHRAPIAESQPAAVQPADQHTLIAESQRLEELLSALPSETRLTRARTEFTVADLEDRIQWVDYRLNLGAESGIEPRQSQLLWRERVELLNSLVAVRYAQARAAAF